CQQYDFDPRTF
nr:immunoglobulin light chain junction region [Macaca mulatta]